MSENQNIKSYPRKDQTDVDSNLADTTSEVASITGQSSTKNVRLTSTAERQIKFERAQKCLENAALVSKRIKEHRKATAELLGRPFEDDAAANQAEMASTVSEKTNYSVATDSSITLSVQDALNIPGISESLANTLKQKELLMERIKQYKEISKRPMKIKPTVKKELECAELKKSSDGSDLSKVMNIVKDKENALSVMQVKLKAMETTVLDLQEKLNEKDQIIEAKHKATTLISDSLTRKEKESISLLEDTKEQMVEMQNNFVKMECEWEKEKIELLSEIKEKNERIKSLEEANTILENSRFEISIAHSKLSDELELKTQEIIELNEKLSKIDIHSHHETPSEEEKGSKEIANMEELTKKIELLEQLNYQIRLTNKELQNQVSASSIETKPITTNVSPSKKGSPLPSRKGGRNPSSKMKSPWSRLSTESLNQEMDKKVGRPDNTKTDSLMQALNKEILDKEYLISEKDALITELKLNIDQKDVIISDLKSMSSQIQEQAEKIDVATDVCTEHIIELKETLPSFSYDIDTNDVTELHEKLKLAHSQIVSLNDEIDTANKNMIKVKSNSKLKLKQMQKTIDNFSKVSDANAEVIRLNEETHQLSQKVAELEEEKGNLQLHLVDYDSGRLTDTDIYKKMVEMENLAETRLKSISLLETQKFDLVQELHLLQQKNTEMEDKLSDITQLQNEQVCSEMKSVQLEEQIDELCATKKELEQVIQNLKLDIDQHIENIKVLQNDKEELLHKLESYIQENIDLTDKLEKLSAEKVSSAESIEIVESLTTQEKLELEEYNKSIKGEKEVKDTLGGCSDTVPLEEKPHTHKQNVDRFVQESAELRQKIDLFTQERQEVMEKMNSLCIENDSLNKFIKELKTKCIDLQNNIDLLDDEKNKVQSLNNDLQAQIENLKRERTDIIKEAVDVQHVPRPLIPDDVVDGSQSEIHQDEKSISDKGSKGVKSMKQMTKEILKLKNLIKEREDEIADCQMKILSLEEQNQKQNELVQSNSSYESKIKQLLEENSNLKKQHEIIVNDSKRGENQLQYKEITEKLHYELQQTKQDYIGALSSRDSKIQELEQLLKEYEKQIFNYNNTLQQKDKEITDYLNQITKLNDMSHKLKSTIELLEQEKANDHNGEVVKSLNQQITLYQNALTECEEKIRVLEEDKVQLLSLKSKLENRNSVHENEIAKLKETLSEKLNSIKELQTQTQKIKEEYTDIVTQAKERDEEIHEIKLQLRKESIENEKLRINLQEKEHVLLATTKQLEEAKDKLESIDKDGNTRNEDFMVLETKNKELLEKLKKFAANIKKRTIMYSDLEKQYNDLQNQFELKNEKCEEAMIQVETIPALQEKLKYADEELKSLQSIRKTLENKLQDVQGELTVTQSKFTALEDEILRHKESVKNLTEDIQRAQDDKQTLKFTLETLNNKIAQFEIEQRNNTNFSTKISCLETDLIQRQQQISDLTQQLQYQEQNFNQLQYGHDAKVQERDVYIENLQTENEKYRSRICRLEESISVMENRRYSLEKKADQLDIQLQDKQKAYNEYSSQEDELICRLAVLMDHDKVVEKQLQEIEKDNKDLQFKIQHLNEELLSLRSVHADLQHHSNNLEIQVAKIDEVEAETVSYRLKSENLEANIRKMSSEHQNLLAQRKFEIDELESEFNTQIEKAIKDKKALGEKYEKLNEEAARLEYDIQGYRSTIENLQITIEEITSENKKLVENSNIAVVVPPDYTEQYISEINRLTSVINEKSLEINNLQSKIDHIQFENNSFKQSTDIKFNELSIKLNESLQRIELTMRENEILISKNNELNNLLCQKEDQIKQLIEKKKVVFEMNIPKTEGMMITSTIEELNDEQRTIEMLQSQIISDVDESNKQIESEIKRVTRDVQNLPVEHSTLVSGGLVEPMIVPKKTYLCHKEDVSENQEVDLFNSEEGWGLQEQDDSEYSDITPGMTRLNEEIQQLKDANTNLKKELDISHTKLLKALKMLKELKSSNEMLSNELKISKQISKSDMFDMAIESELSNNINVLEKKVQDLSDILNREKKEKETLSKQNVVLLNGNERLIEIKEKLDNELELWKYKFKEANDKISGTNISSNIKTSDDSVPVLKSTTETKLQEEIEHLEKENDELQSSITYLSNKNKELSDQVLKLDMKLNETITELQNSTTTDENNTLRLQVKELQNNKDYLTVEVAKLTEQYNALQIQHKEMSELCEKNKTDNVLQKSQNELLLQEIESLNYDKENTSLLLDSLKSELDTVKNELVIQVEHSSSQTNVINEKVKQYELEIQELSQKDQQSNEKQNEFEIKLQQLNSENDQLLSTVAELRSSVSSAMDQRGFEIAELWKQHLAQRESEFLKMEEDFRTQLSTAESKYEQLLDNVQSSTQDETNKIVMVEQVTSLQSKLQEKEELICSLKDKYAEVMHQLDMLRSEMEDEKVLNDDKVLTHQEEYEKIINDLKFDNQKLLNDQETLHNSLQLELSATKTVNDSLNQRVEELRTEYDAKSAELSKQIQLKDSEIFQKTHDYTIMLADRNAEFENVRKQLVEYEKKVEELTYERETELAVLRLKMHEKNKQYEISQKEILQEKDKLVEELNVKIIECNNLNKQIVDLNSILQEYQNKTAETQMVLESQELEIVTLKDEIASIRETMKSTSSKIEKHVTFASNTKQSSSGVQDESVLNKELLDAVPRAELDLALYMLHQRDVRCEELTMELTQLLEERDTLQLRLSDSLRSFEDLKSRYSSVGLNETASSSVDTLSELPSFTVEKEQPIVDIHRAQTSRSSSISETDSMDKPKLQAKLSELRSVKHSRDVTFRQESEQRQLGMRLLQRDVANLPAEAVDQLTQAHHTLSRDSQSTPTVLLNWLRGKSTPKVVHM